MIIRMFIVMTKLVQIQAIEMMTKKQANWKPLMKVKVKANKALTSTK